MSTTLTATRFIFWAKTSVATDVKFCTKLILRQTLTARTSYFIFFALYFVYKQKIIYFFLKHVVAEVRGSRLLVTFVYSF